jgi:hypothetical protein
MKKITTVAVVAAVLGSVAAARAGYKYWNDQVTVDIPNRIAGGQVGAVRNNNDSTSYIGCQTEGWDSSSGFAAGYRKIVCQARDANGTYASCWNGGGQSGAPSAIVTVSEEVKGDAYVVFAWDASGMCSYVRVENYSQHAAKWPW